jgi:hypothetical protein
MTRNWPILFAALAGMVFGFAWASRGPDRIEAKDSLASAESELAAIKAEIQAAKDRLPDQAHAMQDVANQFTNMSFAASSYNWELAQFYLGETRNHLRWAVRIIPKRKDNAGRDVDLVSILQAMEKGPIAQLEAVIKAKDNERFAAAYRSAMENCYACHKAAGKPYLRPQIPRVPSTQIINFNPDADWPK